MTNHAIQIPSCALIQSTALKLGKVTWAMPASRPQGPDCTTTSVQITRGSRSAGDWRKSIHRRDRAPNLVLDTQARLDAVRIV